VKAELNIASTTKTTLISEEKNSVINYYKSYFEWFYSNVSLSPKATSEENNHVYEVLDEIDLKYTNMLKEDAIFELFVSNQELRMAKTELRNFTLKSISSDTVKFLFEVVEANIQTIYCKSIIDTVKEISAKETYLKKLAEESEKKINAHKQFMKSVAKINAEVYPEQIDFQKKCKEHLYSLAIMN